MHGSRTVTANCRMESVGQKQHENAEKTEFRHLLSAARARTTEASIVCCLELKRKIDEMIQAKRPLCMRIILRMDPKTTNGNYVTAS